MADLKREYNVPLRKEYLKVPKHTRAKKAVKALKQFLVRHMKSDMSNIRIGPFLNEHIWENGMRNPPHHVKINTIKDGEGIVRAELASKPMFELKKADKTPKKEKSAIEEKIEGLVGGKKGSASKSSAKKEAAKKAAEKKAEKSNKAAKDAPAPEPKKEPAKQKVEPKDTSSKKQSFDE